MADGTYSAYYGIIFNFGIFFGGVFWGAHTCLFMWFLNLTRGKTSLNRWMKLACIAGYIISTTTIAVCLVMLYDSLDVGFYTFFSDERYSKRSSQFFCVQDWLYFISMMISDAVQIWRCLVIWGRSRLVFITLGALLFISTVSGLIAYLIEIVGIYVVTSDSVNMANNVAADLNLASSLLLNILATGLTAYKIRTHTKQIRAVHGPRDRELRHFERLIAMILETGLVYTAAQLYYFIIGSVLSNDTLFNATAVSFAHAGPVVQVLVCMYPTTVIVFAAVAKRADPEEEHPSAAHIEFTAADQRVPSDPDTTEGATSTQFTHRKDTSSIIELGLRSTNESGSKFVAR